MIVRKMGLLQLIRDDRLALHFGLILRTATLQLSHDFPCLPQINMELGKQIFRQAGKQRWV